MFWRRKKKLSLPGHREPLSSAVLISVAGVEDEARALAVLGRPKADETAISRSEARVVEIVAERIRARHGEDSEEAHGIRSLLAGLPETNPATVKETLPRLVERRVRGTFAAGSGQISRVIEEERTSEASLNALRHKDGVEDRPASFPASQTKHWALIGVVGCGEAASMTGLYANSSGAGWFGGLMSSVCVTAMTMIAGAMCGIAFRYMQYETKEGRPHMWWARPTFVLSLLLGVGVAWVACHYRELAGEGNAFVHAFTAPFDISLLSYAVYSISTTCAGFVAYKAFTASDVVPGYAKATLRHQDAVAETEDLKSRLEGELDAIRETEVDGSVALKLQAARGMLDEAARREIGLKRQVERTADLDRRDIRLAADAINRFRQLNGATRADGVRPDYFASAVDFTKLIPDVGHDDLGALTAEKLAQLEANRSGLLKVVSHEIDRIEFAKQNVKAIMFVMEKGKGQGDDVANLPDVTALITPHERLDEWPALPQKEIV